MSNDHTYSQDPSLSSRDKVRFLCGDTDADDRLLTDAEIEWLITSEPTVYMAASMACRTLASKFARMTDKAVGDLKISYSQRQKAYSDLAGEYERRHLTGGDNAAVFQGGVSKDDRDSRRDDSDRIQPGFRVDQDNSADAASDESRLWNALD